MVHLRDMTLLRDRPKTSYEATTFSEWKSSKMLSDSLRYIPRVMQQLTPSFSSHAHVAANRSDARETLNHAVRSDVTTNQSVALDRVGLFGSSENNSLAIGLGVAFFFAYLIPFIMGSQDEEDSVTKKVNKLSEWPDSNLEINFGPIVRNKTEYYNGFTEYGDAILELIQSLGPLEGGDRRP